MKTALYFLAAGALMGGAMQAMKYAIPDPALRVVVCMATDTGIEACESAQTLLARAKTKGALE